MFTTPCFIRKNTPELREELKAIGYVASALYSPKERYLMAFRAGLYDSTDITDHLNRIKGLGYIDCGENEVLFMAIAALRDNTDDMQFFKIRDLSNGLIVDKCVRCRRKRASKRAFGLKINRDYEIKKLTVEEIIEHFAPDINVTSK